MPSIDVRLVDVVQVNVIGTIIFVVAVALVLLSTLWQRRVAARDYKAGAV